MAAYEGGCQCGALRYAVSAEPRVTSVCHCSECKRQTGSAFGMSMVVERDAFSFTAGEPKIFTRPADSGGTVECGFCPECGTRIYHMPSKMPDTLNVKPGTLDDPSAVRPGLQVFTRRRADWVEIAGDHPEFSGNVGEK